MKLIIDPELSFAGLAVRLAAELWQQAPDPTAPLPIIPGEPESAEFRRGLLRLHYQFEPATGLRELRTTGKDGEDALAALATRLPCLGVEQARALLASPDKAARLLGLRIGARLQDYALLGDVAGLMNDPNPTIARQALETGAQLVAQPATGAARLLGEWQAAHP
ncbi:MAG: hypothetical protein ACLGI6_06970, partial [Gammaproteobacteria bacterium]